MDLDLESIAGNLAGKHGLSKDKYLNSRITSVYPIEGEIDLPGTGGIMVGSGQSDDYLRSFAAFLKEINPELAQENYELVYEEETSEGNSRFYLELIYNSSGNVKELKGVKTEIDITLSKGIVTAHLADFISEEDNPKLEEVFDVISKGYKDIQNSI